MAFALALATGCAAAGSATSTGPHALRPTPLDPAAATGAGPTPGAPVVSPAPLDPSPDAAAVDHAHYAVEEEAPDDGAEPDPVPIVAAPRAPHPLVGLSDAEVARRVASDLAALGSMSVGRPSAGALVGGVQLPEHVGWVRVDPGHAWGTRETIDYLTEAVTRVRQRFPDAHPLYVGHISGPRGGALHPHVSHQAGRDVDISFYYLNDGARWYARAGSKNLDVEKTWAFVRALIEHTDIELILCDHSIQRLLREHALSIGEDPVWVASVFDGVPGSLRPLIVHAKGHATHLHLRFYNPIAQETARRAHRALVESGIVKPPTYFITHRVKKGETLGMLARKYGTTVREIQRANGLRSTKIIAKQSYRIPRRGQALSAAAVAVPARRTPPPRAGRASVGSR